MGLVDLPHPNQRQRGAVVEGIFEAGKLRMLLVRLVCGADPTKPPRDEDRNLFGGFDLIQGHPHVSWMGRRPQQLAEKQKMSDEHSSNLTMKYSQCWRE